MSKFVVDPSLPFAATVNREIAAAERQSFPEIYNGIRSSFNSDPLVGTIIPGTNIEWNKSSETQSLIFVSYGESGMDQSNMQAVLDANKGPNEPWNFSYEQFGLIIGIGPDPSLKVVSVVQQSTGNLLVGFLVPGQV